MFSQASVILFTGGSVHLSACWDTPLSRHPPQEQTPPEQRCPLEQTPPSQSRPPWEETPREQTPPQSRHPPVQSMLGDTVNARAVRTLLECKLVCEVYFANRYCSY